MKSQWTHHGGRLTQARASYGEAQPWLDLSTGINPHCWPHAESLAVDWRRLPDEHALAELEAAAADHFGVDPTHLAALPGTEIGLRLLETLLPGPSRHVWPAYRTHSEMFLASTPAALAELTNQPGGVCILANPNNPDGHVTGSEEMQHLLQRQRAASGWLVVDEAFVDAQPPLSLAPHIGDDRPLILFRSFGKFFGLAGVRLGFVIGPRPFIGRIRQRLGAWPVSAAAIAIGTAAYRDRSWAAAMRDRLQAEASVLHAMLERHGFKVSGDCPLFRLLEVENAARLFDRLAHQAILTRPFDYHPGWLRIGLPESAEALGRLDRALRHG